ncbi:SDR family oxidoreductase [Daejeonella lutea]|uniref:dTDP-4-dehydrorhamnose reductase n=1 Tax=Daejeonella lutea TaxID=572036 RepID=A0A1T5F108_9SPHI|nr:SDR family oxidoreductase [Daejeonella lutea]SKB89806.1 dTDP-4-dehydrorhamnose reductase [Daejeonella lutea]
MKRILVTGSNGLLGQKLTDISLLDEEIELIATAVGENRHPVKSGYIYEEFDIRDGGRLSELIEKYRPDAVINTAAMTNVDTCEAERSICKSLNVDAVATMSSVCEKNDVHLIHISTDFIFDGEDGPYAEDAEPNPLSYYGETKLQAEELLKLSKGRWTILRTIIVYGIVSDMSRSNIVLWAKGALEKGLPINVVNDQWRMPTLAEDLALACILAVKKEAQGVYNTSGKDLMSILEIVERVADFYELDKSLINPISAESLNQAAKRPKKTGFILDKAIHELGYQPKSFEEGIRILDEQFRRNTT